MDSDDGTEGVLPASEIEGGTEEDGGEDGRSESAGAGAGAGDSRGLPDRDRPSKGGLEGAGAAELVDSVGDPVGAPSGAGRAESAASLDSSASCASGAAAGLPSSGPENAVVRAEGSLLMRRYVLRVCNAGPAWTGSGVSGEPAAGVVERLRSGNCTVP